MARTRTWVVPEFQVSFPAGGVNRFLGSPGIGIHAAPTTSWLSMTSSHNAARNAVRPLPTPGQVPSRQRQRGFVKHSSRVRGSLNSAPVRCWNSKLHSQCRGFQMVKPPAPLDPGTDGSSEFQTRCVHRIIACQDSDTNRGSWLDRDFEFALRVGSVAGNGVVGRNSGGSPNWRRVAQPM